MILKTHPVGGIPIAGSIVSAGVYLDSSHTLNQEPSLKGFLLSLGVGATVGVLPDILEPATSSYHRSFFHSMTFASLSGYLIYKALNNEDIDNEVKLIMSVMGSAYGSHLVLDGLTPRGLPLIGSL